MLPADLLTSPLPPFLAFVVVMFGMGLRFLRQRDDAKQSEWDRMRDLLEELRQQRDRQDRLVEDLTADNARLRTDLREALRHHNHEEEPT